MVQNADPNSLASYLHAKVELDRAELTRQLHDNLGGLIVAALMDSAWAEQNLTSSAVQALEKLRRVRQSLGAAIDLKRKLIEDLRPTLLDNFGLLAALNWQLKQCGADTRVNISGTFPASEPPLSADTAIALFRYVEEAIHLVVDEKTANSIKLEVTSDATNLKILLSHDGEPFSETDESNFPQFASLKHRIWGVRGTFEVLHTGGASALSAIVPLNSQAA